jgi:L-ascorbate metabolism protein UlaG (beta-lactamase superfamily)
MSKGHEKHAVRICPKTGRRIEPHRRHWWAPWVLPFIGLASLVWFLIRVIPKPSRATYPCQRLAAPLASTFVIWLTGLAASTLAYRRARYLFAQSRYVLACLFLLASVGALWWSLGIDGRGAGAAFVPSDPPNSPIGVGKGIHPGRVVWVHDPESTSWNGTTGAWWDDANVNQQVVDTMVSQSLRALTGASGDAAAWDALFRHFNHTRNLGDLGYQPGEKVVIKINMNQDSGGTWNSRAGMPSPQMIHSLLEQLIHVAGVPGSAITLYDASRYIGDPIYNKVRGNPDPEFQSVQFVCNATRNGRTAATQDLAHPIRFADPSVPGGGRAYPPRVVTEAKYLINMALLRAHSLFGVTFCGKNHFGSIYWPGNGGWTPQPLHNFGSRDQAMGSYNCLVDLTGHAQLGGKTLLCLIDGLYAARNQSAEVIRFASFGDDWTSSLLLSQDPIAIDSVALDFVRNESRATDCTGRGVDNYLHEGALADNPPSGVFYDPEGDGTRLESLGVHEHWNNAVDKKYSRNLGAAEGIELVVPSRAVADGPVQNHTQGIRYSYIRHAIEEAMDGDVIVAAPGTYHETVIFGGKAITVRSQNPNDLGVVAATIIDGGAEAVSFIHGEDGNSVLAGFTAAGATRGIYCSGAAPTILNCRILENVEAGVKLWEGSDPVLVNCIIAGNGGAGVEMWAAKTGRTVTHNFATIDHCTIVGNRGGAIDGGKPVVTNSIVRSNSPDGKKPQIAGDAPTVTYSNVEGGHDGTGNIDVDPKFVESGEWINVGAPTASWARGNYHLLADSPCVDAGDPAFMMNVTRTDIDGHARISGGRTDIGCDEVPQPIYVTWLGHASVKIAWKDIAIYVDPYRLTVNPQDADLILISHSHGDHYSPADIARVRDAQTQFVGAADVVTTYGSGQSLAPGQTLDVAGVRVTGVAAYNTNKTNHPKANHWLGFIIEIGGNRIYCAGDTDLTPELKAVTDIDVAFLPAGGTYTMNATEAAEATKYIQPTLAIPYHWGTSVGTLADAQHFAQLAACNVKVLTAGQTVTSEDWSGDFTFVAHWKLDETQGARASDSAGNYDGTLVGGPVWQPTAGRIDGAIQFDGVDDFITTASVLNPSEGVFSIFAWVKDGAPGQTILAQIGGESWLLADASGALATQLKQSGRGGKDLVSAGTITDGQWRRVGLTWDGSARTLYVDDVEVARDTQAGLGGLAAGLRIGGGPSAEPDSFWSGWIDDIRIYTRVIVP